MQEKTGKPGLALNRRAFGRMALAGAATLVAGSALAAESDDVLQNDYVPDSQDAPRLLRRISGLHTEEWQNHFSSI